MTDELVLVHDAGELLDIPTREVIRLGQSGTLELRRSGRADLAVTRASLDAYTAAR